LFPTARKGEKENITGDVFTLGKELRGLTAIAAVRVGELDHLIFPVADFQCLFKRNFFYLSGDDFELPRRRQIIAVLSDELPDDQYFRFRRVVIDLHPRSHFVQPFDGRGAECFIGQVGEIFLQ